MVYDIKIHAWTSRGKQTVNERYWIHGDYLPLCRSLYKSYKGLNIEIIVVGDGGCPLRKKNLKFHYCDGKVKYDERNET